MIDVNVYTVDTYDVNLIRKAIEKSGVLDLIKPGMRIVIKPNWVAQCGLHSKRWENVITHPAVIQATVSVVLKKLNGKGRISLVDAPMGWANFDKIQKICHIENIAKEAAAHNVEFEVFDLRDDAKVAIDTVTIYTKKLCGDARGKTLVDLGENSEFCGFSHVNPFYGAAENIAETNAAHAGGHHCYSVSTTVMEADVFINLPKCKTHKKAGITCSLKNLVGINTNKNLLPHHTIGAVCDGGDQTPDDDAGSVHEARLVNFTKRTLNRFRFMAIFAVLGKKVVRLIRGENDKRIRGGGWYGNNTIWRMILDLNKVLLYADSNGKLYSQKQREYVSIVDAILAGEGNGPCEPLDYPMHKLVIGCNPVYVDEVCAALMGLDWRKIPSILHATQIKHLPLITSDHFSIRIDDNEDFLEHIFSTCQQAAIPALGWEILSRN